MMEKQTVEIINLGARKKKRQNKELKRKSYKDQDPLCVNFKKSCNHKAASKFHCSSINIEQVIKNRKRFFDKSNKIEQDIYLTRFLCPYEPQRRGNYVPKRNSKTKKRTVSVAYYLYSFVKKKNVLICRSFFMATFSISKARINRIAKRAQEGKIPKEGRGGDRKSKNSTDKKNKVREFIKKLQAKESDYNRNKSKRIYLAAELNVKKLIHLYNASVPTEFKVKRSMFYEIFYEFNIGFSSPASDACTACTLWSNKIKFEQDPWKKQLAITEKRVHKMRANCFYNSLKNCPPNSVTYCFDLQQQQPLAKTPIQEAFYSRQIYLYNFCIAPTQEKCKPFLYVWTEDVAGRGATEIGSAIYNFLCNEFPEDSNSTYDLIRFFCDGCGGQNKNSHIIHLLMFWLYRKAPKNIKEIHLIFPVSGHSFLSADRILGHIEKDLRKKSNRQKRNITTKEEYVEIFSIHGHVKYLGQDWQLYDLKTLDQSLKKLNNIQYMKKILLRKKARKRIDVEVKALQNYRFESNERFESLLKRGKRFPLTMPAIEQRHIVIKTAKKKDVENLLIKQFGEGWHELPELAWYKNIISYNYTETAIEDEEYQEEDCCICLEPDIGDIRV